MKKVTAEGRADWACHLINGDSEGMAEDDFADMQRWLAFHGVQDDECVGVDDTGGFGRPDAPYGFQLYPSNLATYTFLVDKEEYAARCA